MIPAIFLWLGINAVQAQTRLSIEDCPGEWHLRTATI